MITLLLFLQRAFSVLLNQSSIYADVHFYALSAAGHLSANLPILAACVGVPQSSQQTYNMVTCLHETVVILNFIFQFLAWIFKSSWKYKPCICQMMIPE